MEKSYDLKKDPRYGNSDLRQKINESIKRQRDDLLELDAYLAKGFVETPVIENRDSFNELKNRVKRSFTDS